MMERNKHFDEEIRQKLENLQAGYDPNSWDILAHRMDFEAQQEVDDIFKSRLEGMNAAMPPSSWDALEQMIEADEAAEVIEKEAHLDNVAYDKLHDLRAPYEQQHWVLMAKRLEEEYSLRNQIYRYKIAEIVLMALLLLSIIRFTPLIENWLQSSPDQPQIIQHTPVQPIANAVQSVDHHSIPQDQLDNRAMGTLQGNKISNSGIGVNDLDFKIDSKSLQFHKPTLRSDSENGNVPSSNTQNKESSFPKLQPLPYNTLTQLDYPSSIASTFGEKVKELLLQKHLVHYLKHNNYHQPKFVTALAISGIEPEYAWELPSIKVNPAKKKSDLRFSIFTSTDFNYVTTPPTQIRGFGDPVQTKYNETIAMGYGGGVNISWKKDRWEYQTGGIYSFKRYIPNTPLLIFETINFWVREDFNGIQMDILQLPFNALYHFKNTGKWRFYASAGLSTHFVIKTVYEIDYDRKALNLSGGSSPDDTKSLKKYKDFPNGLADGGKLRDNFYMSANVGIGAEYYLSPKWTIFFQPNYQHFMMSGGIGTNKDKIYTSSLYIGTKFNLK